MATATAAGTDPFSREPNGEAVPQHPCLFFPSGYSYGANHRRQWRSTSNLDFVKRPPSVSNFLARRYAVSVVANNSIIFALLIRQAGG